MAEPTITCPNCKTEIKLTESLAAPLVADTRRRYEEQLTARRQEIAGREQTVRDQQAAVEQASADLDAQVAQRVAEVRERIAEEEAIRTQRSAELDLQAKDRARATVRSLSFDLHPREGATRSPGGRDSHPVVSIRTPVSGRPGGGSDPELQYKFRSAPP